MAGLQTEQRGWRSSKIEFILFVGDNCKSNIGREGAVVSVSKGLQHGAAAPALSGIEMAGKSVQRALVTQQGGGGQGGGKGLRAEKSANLLPSKAPPLLLPSAHVRVSGKIVGQLELVGERGEEVLDPILLLPVLLGQRAEDFPQLERSVSRHRKVDRSPLSSQNLVRLIC